MKSNKALLFGASGLIGSELLKVITSDDSYTEIIIFSRKPLEATTARTRVVLFETGKWEGIESHFTPNAKVFCCIGTTRNKTPNLEEYKSIDYGIPVKLAEFAARGSCQGFYVVSALGASAASMNFYTKIKGEMERDVAKRGVRETYFFRPSLLLGKREESRPGESLAKVVNSLISPVMMGPLRRYKGVEASTVAKAMWKVSREGSRRQVITNEEILTLGA